MTPDPRIAKAREMREQGATLQQIADAFGISRSYACRWTKPGSLEADRERAREWKERNRDRNRERDRAYAADPLHRGRCMTCGGLMGIGIFQDGVCRSCQHDARLARARTIEEMWAAGERFSAIAQALGWSQNALCAQPTELGREGLVDLPHRYTEQRRTRMRDERWRKAV